MTAQELDDAGSVMSISHMSGLSDLSISDLAERTGVPAATLRSWERRYGAPQPQRLPGGHRRYSEQDVNLVGQIHRLRESGLGLSTAVQQARAHSRVGMRSLFAPLRHRHPELVPRAVTKRTLLALARAVEDECCAVAQQPVLFGTFENTTAYAGSKDRWQEMARTAEFVAVISDFDKVSRAGTRPIEIPTPPTSALRREWAVVCDAPDLAAALVATRRPSDRRVDDARQIFEVMWTVDPRTVRAATRMFAELTRAFAPRVSIPQDERLASVPAAASDDLRRAAGLLDRMVGYLDAR